jgi:AcrR family transcriptional regulator
MDGHVTQQPQDHSHGADHDAGHDTRQRLMEAALLVFAEKGFDGASVREIAKGAKVNQAMIAYHFGSKEGLYEAAMRWVCTEFSSRVHRAIDAARPGPTAAACPGSGAALEGIRAILGDLFRSIVLCDRGEGRRGLLFDAGHRLWDQEMANPRLSLLEFVIEQVRVPMERIVACINVLRPDLSGLELDTMLMGIHGAIFLFHKHSSFIAKMRGVPYSSDDLELMAEYFVDFSVRGLGVPLEAGTDHKEA